jgi:hypothetical protein
MQASRPELAVSRSIIMVMGCPPRPASPSRTRSWIASRPARAR